MNPTLNLILQNVITLIALILTPVAIALANQLIKKMHLANVEATEAKVDGFIQTGMAAAEKASLNKLKADQPAIPGEAKLAKVIEYVSTQIKENKLPEKTAEAITAKIDAKLFNSNGVAKPVPVEEKKG